MPQSIQIVPKWSYPYVETIINDYSQVVDKTKVYPIDPVVTYAFPFVSPKGVDNKFVRKYSPSRFEATFGKSNYKKYGQPLMMPYAVLDNPNVYVWGMRVMPVNAAYSNNLITLNYRIDKNINDVEPSQRKFRINFTQRAIEDVYTNKEFIDLAYAIYKDPNRTYLTDDFENPPVVGEFIHTQYVKVADKDDPEISKLITKDPTVMMVVDDSVMNLDEGQVHYSDVIATVYSKNEFELTKLRKDIADYTRAHPELTADQLSNDTNISDKLNRIEELVPLVEAFKEKIDSDEVDSSSEVQAIRNIEVGDYVKAYEWKVAPFMGVRSAGRGVYGDNYRIRISPNTNYEKEYGIKMFDFQILSMEEGLQTVASYTGALSSSDKYESITLINDILENADEGDVPVYVYVSEENLKVVYNDYVSFLKELHPDLIAERDHKLARYTEAYRLNKGLDKASAELQMKKMVNGKQRAYSTDRIVLNDDESDGLYTLCTVNDFNALEIVADNTAYFDNSKVIKVSTVEGMIPNYIHVSSKNIGARLVVSNEFPAHSFKPEKMIRIGDIDTSDRPVSINDYVAKTGIGNYVVRGIIKSTAEMVNELKQLNNLISATLDKNIVDFDQFDPLYAQKVASSALLPCISFSDGVTTDGQVPIFAQTSGISLKRGSDGYFANPRYVEILEDDDTSEPSIVFPFQWAHPVTTMIAPERVKVIRYEKQEYSISDTDEAANDVSYEKIIEDSKLNSSLKGEIIFSSAMENLSAQGTDISGYADNDEDENKVNVIGKYLKKTIYYFEQVTTDEFSLYDRMFTGGKNKLEVIDDDPSENYDIQTQAEKSKVIAGLVTGYMRCDPKRDGALEVVPAKITNAQGLIVDNVPGENEILVTDATLKHDIENVVVGDHVINVTANIIRRSTSDDPVYVIKQVKPVYISYNEYTVVSKDNPSETGPADSLKVLADSVVDSMGDEFDATSMVKLSDVINSHDAPSISDVKAPYVKWEVVNVEDENNVPVGVLKVVANDIDSNEFNATTMIRLDDASELNGIDENTIRTENFIESKTYYTYVKATEKKVSQYRKIYVQDPNDKEQGEIEITTPALTLDDYLTIDYKAGKKDGYPSKTFTKDPVYIPITQTDTIYLYPDEDTGKMPVDDDEKGGPIIHEDGSINTSRVAYTTDAIQWTLQQEIDECLINAFNGTYDRKILSPRRIPVDAWFDANFSFPVKQALCELVTARNDAPVFLDTGIEDKVYSTERMNALIEQFKEFTNDTAKYNTKLISKNLQHYKIREEGTMKRVDVSITYFLAKKFAEHVLNFGTHFPFVKGKCELSGHLRDTLQPALEDFEAEKKELLYNNHFNYFETRDDNIFQRASQSTSQAELSDLSEENNIFTLYNIKRILENDIHDSLYDFADANTRQSFTAYETAKFASWIGTKVLSLSIHFDVSEWEFDHSILHCYVAVVFRGLQKRAILEIDINKRVYDGETEATAGSVAI